MNHSGAKVHAVVWLPTGTQTPADLADALKKQGIAWEEALGPFDALARLLTPRESSPRGLVLLLVEPAQLPGSEKVRSAIEQFIPATGCWAYRTSENPHLAPLSPPAKPAEPEIVVRPAPPPRAEPRLKLAGNGSRRAQPQAEAEIEPPNPHNAPHGTPHKTPGTPPSESTSEPESPHSVLTPEELEMLLADDQE